MYIFLILISLILSSSVQASTSNVNVETHVESSNTSVVNVETSSTSHKKVEIDINGEKHVYESDKPGDQTIKVESIDGKATINTSEIEDQQINPSPDVKNEPIPSPTPLPDLFKNIPQTSLATYIIDSIKEFLNKFF